MRTEDSERATAMNVKETEIEGIRIIEPAVFRDSRGYFCETYNEERYRAAGIAARFVQDNESLSSRGVVRGLHWQAAPHTQAKLVRVVHGAALDVAVDIRKGSPTYGKHFATVLSGENCRQLFIPRGLAHGFIVLENDTLFSYKCDNLYEPGAEMGMRFDDPALGIEWPELDIALTLSEKDRRHPFFAQIAPWEDCAP